MHSIYAPTQSGEPSLYIALLAALLSLVLLSGCSSSVTPLTPSPVISPASGTYTVGQTVTIADSASNATIYYTVDGTTPTTSSPKYTTPIVLNGTHAVTVNAIAAASGMATSTITVAAFTATVPAPIFTPPAGNYSSVQTVTITDAVQGTSIYYTTNGSAPSTSSTLYSTPIAVGVSETLNAIAVLTGFPNSSVGTAAYSIVFPTAATPVFSPAAGMYNSIQTVSITETTQGVKVYYTTDGSTPTSASTLYTGPISVTKTETLNAIAIGVGFTNSAVATALYTLNLPVVATPAITPASGTYTTAQTVTITDTTAGATIYYTTDGSTPTSASSVYTAPISVKTSETVSAIAEASGYNNSVVATATYTLVLNLTGSVLSKSQPIKGATVTLYAVGTGGYGSSASVLGTPAMTDSSGNFSVPYFCMPDTTQVYLVATGGQSTSAGVNNSGLALTTALGACSSLTPSSTAIINEVTTVASVWALQQFISATYGTAGSFHLGAPTSNAIGISNAFAAVSNMVNLQTGVASLATALSSSINSSSVTVNVLSEQTRLNTLANILASCVDSNDAPVGTPSTACKTLFSTVTPTGQTAAPVDTLQAALDIASNPATTTAYTLGSNAIYTPALTAAPNDFTLALDYNSPTLLGATGAQTYFLYSPPTIAIDSNGNVYSMNGPASTTTSPYDSVSSIAPSGLPIANFYGGTMLNQPRGMALDTSNNVWVVNQATTTPANAVVEFTQAGTVNNYSFASGLYGIAIDGKNNVFVGSNGGQEIAELISGVLHGLGTATGPETIAIDANNNVWSVGFSVTSAYKFGATCTSTSCTYSAPILYTGLSSPFSIAIDANNNPWVSEPTPNELAQLNPATPAGGSIPTAAKLGGLGSPQYIAIDGKNNIWAANSSPASVTELSSTTVARSPATGFSHAYNSPRGIAIDLSGNVWVGNSAATSASGSYVLTEIIGAAAPTVQPLSHALQLGKIGQLP